MPKFIAEISAQLQELTGIQGSFGYVVVLVLVLLGYSFLYSQERSLNDQRRGIAEAEAEEEPDPPRNFTLKQLRYFDGTKEESRSPSGEITTDKPVYLSLNGTVFDVTKGRDFYGPGGAYEMFAGRECGAALAKMSFDEAHLDDVEGCKNLNYGEKQELQGWIEKFQYYRCYPIMGKLISNLPDPTRIMSMEELAKHDGSGETPPEGYGAMPIYLGARGKVYDVSFGGVTFYGPGCSYNRFAGKDASRALAKMSFEPVDIENRDISDLTEKELKVLDDWVKTFEERKNYPCVGCLE